MNIVISGASRGIGKAIAEIFAANGHQLFICSRNDTVLQATASEIRARYPGSEVHAKAFDLAVPENASAFGNWCLQTGVPDVLVNNAGLFEPGGVADEPDGALERQIATNLYSAYYLTRAVLPAMKEKRSGHVFNMCSIASLNAYKNGGAYSISKFALNGFNMNLREEMKPHGIKVTGVYPGAVMTDSWAGFDNSNSRIMEPGDVATMVYAASGLSLQACVEEIVIRPRLGDL